MEPWQQIANGPLMLLCGFILGGVASFGAYLMYRKAHDIGLKIGFTKEQLREALRASAVTVIGPSLGIVVGMIGLMIVLSPGIGWLRESAGIGSIMYELITAMFGAQAAGETLGPEMTAKGFATALLVMSVACTPWLVGLVATP